MSIKQFLALEEETPSATEVGYDPEANVSNALLETQEASVSADAQLETIDEATNTAGALDSLSEAIDATLPEGGLTEPVAQALTAAVEHMRSRLGYQQRIMPAMESFSRSNRKIATESVMDSIRNTAKAVWEAIVKAFNAAYDWIKKTFNSIFGGAAKVRKKEAAARKAEDDFKKANSDAEVDEAIKEAMAGMNRWSENFGKKEADGATSAMRQAAESERAQDSKRKADEESLAKQKSHDATADAVKRSSDNIHKANAAFNDSGETKKKIDKIILYFLNDKNLAHYFRKNEKECFSAKEIDDRFIRSYEQYSHWLTFDNGQALPQLVELLKRRTGKLKESIFNIDKLGNIGTDDNFVENVMHSVNSGKGLSKLSSGEAKEFADIGVYDVYKINLPFDEDLLVASVKPDVEYTLDNISGLGSGFVKRTGLTNQSATLQLSGVKADTLSRNAASKALENNLGKHIENVEKALDDLLQESKKMEQELDHLPPPQAQQALQRIKRDLMKAQSCVVRVLSVCKNIGMYEIRMLSTLMDYRLKSIATLQAVIDAGKTK